VNGVHPDSPLRIAVLSWQTVAGSDSMLLVPLVFSLANLCVNVAIWAGGDLGPSVQSGLFEPNETDCCRDRTALLFTLWAGLPLVHVCLRPMPTYRNASPCSAVRSLVRNLPNDWNV
jgi:hypothetical protein